jgi:hypothetical protein
LSPFLLKIYWVKRSKPRKAASMLVGMAGVEPTMAVSKTAALPLGYIPVIINFCWKIRAAIFKEAIVASQ